MKSIHKKLLAATLLWLAAIAPIHADTWFTLPSGTGIQSQTDYGEDYDFNYSLGFTAPAISGSSYAAGSGYALTLVVDTDYAPGYYYWVAYLQVGGVHLYLF